MMLLALSSDNVNLLATVLCMAAIMILQRINASRQDKKNEAVLQTTRDTNLSVGAIHRLSNSAFGAAKRAVAVSKRNNAVSLRTLAIVMKDDPSGSSYGKQADTAEAEAIVAEKDADDHDRLQAAVDAEIKARADKAALAAAAVPAPVAVVKAAEKVADAAVHAAENVKATNPIPPKGTP